MARKKIEKPETHKVTCPSCGTRYRSPNHPAKKVMCSKCGFEWMDWYKPTLIGKGYDEFLAFKGRFCVCKGSRGSKKSKTAALWHIMKMMEYPEANTLVIRKTERTLKDSCFADLRWAIHRLDIDREWKCTTNPLEITRISTGQKILFRGFDDPFKITSITVPKGYLCFCWIEEAYEITKIKDFETLNESIRGQIPEGYFKRFTITFNPWTDRHWLKARFFDAKDSDILALTTTFRCNEWLDDADKKVFEDMIKNNPGRARVAADGEWGIAEGLIYENWKEFAFNINDVKQIKGIKFGFGLDFGYSNSFTALCCFAVDENQKRVYVFDEMYQNGLINEEIAERIIEMGYGKETIYADCAEPKSIAELKKYGVRNATKANKGKNINFGIQLVQGYKLIIHPQCVHFLTEISMYCWNEDKFGHKLNDPVKENDHLMDALRYGMIAISQGDRFSWD